MNLCVLMVMVAYTMAKGDTRSPSSSGADQVLDRENLVPEKPEGFPVETDTYGGLVEARGIGKWFGRKQKGPKNKHQPSGQPSNNPSKNHQTNHQDPQNCGTVCQWKNKIKGGNGKKQDDGENGEEGGWTSKITKHVGGGVLGSITDAIVPGMLMGVIGGHGNGGDDGYDGNNGNGGDY